MHVVARQKQRRSRTLAKLAIFCELLLGNQCGRCETKSHTSVARKGFGINSMYGYVRTKVTASRRFHTDVSIRKSEGVKQVELYAKFSMQLKADMVPKECGFNQSETASCLCTRVSFSMLACNGKREGMVIGELTQRSIFVITQTQFAIQTQVT